jgi:Capsule polysaccharide biosynthesis protein
VDTILHLCSGGSNLSNFNGHVGLLCEFAADSPLLQQIPQVHLADEMLGQPDEALQFAYPIVAELLNCSPEIEGLKILGIFEEDLLEQTSYIIQVLHLNNWITSHGFGRAHVLSHSPWLDRLRLIQSIAGAEYELTADIPFSQDSSLRRSLGRLRTLRPSSIEVFQRVAPNRSRYLSAMRQRKAARIVERGGIWFYSTSYNCTRIGMEYEPYMPQKVKFLVEDDATGGRRLRELDRERFCVYAWTEASDLPKRAEIREAGKRITEAAWSVSLPGEADLARSILLKSEWWQHFLTRQLPFAMYNSRALERWRQAIAPELVVVGNAGWERALLLRKEMNGVPRVMLQHGVMHWVYAMADQPVDMFLLRGPFFQRHINDRLRQKTAVRNFQEPMQPAPGTHENRKGDILFVTTPYEVLPMFHREDLKDILRSLLRASVASGRRLIVRVHPQEKVALYMQIVRNLQSDVRLNGEVVYSQGMGVEEVLATSSVAVLYFSTMFLDCLRHRIPIVSFGWHWFPNKSHFEAEEIFHFARDLAHLELLIKNGVDGQLLSKQGGLDDFLARTEPQETSHLFQQIWQSRTRSHAKTG